MTIFAVLDVETTGLSPQKNFVLEIAWRLVDKHLQPLLPTRTYLVELGDDWGEAVAQIQASEFLLTMHTESDLFADLHLADRPTLPMADIIERFEADVRQVDPDGVHMVRLCGLSVSFDREFLRANGWHKQFAESGDGFRFHHRILDLSSVIQLFEAADAEVPYVDNDNPHRALEDVNYTLALAQRMRDVI